jgi:Family of unknown function (DUF6518)
VSESQITQEIRMPERSERPEFVLGPRRRRNWFQVLLVLAFLVGVAAGVGTSYLQGVLPGPTNSLANSGAVWSMVAFLVALASRQQGARAAAIGALALLGEVAGYYAIASPLRDIPSSTNERLLWVAAAIVVGPIVGLAAGWWTGGRLMGRLAAASVMSGIVLGEGVHGLVRVEFSGIQWWIEVVLGAAVGSIAATYYGKSTFWRVVGILGTLVVAGAVYAAYGDTVNRWVFG